MIRTKQSMVLRWAAVALLVTLPVAPAWAVLGGGTYVATGPNAAAHVGATLRARTEPLGPGISGFFDEQLTVTLLLGAVGFLFWFLLRKGFNRNVLVLAVPLVTAYLVLNGLLLGGGIRYLIEHPHLVERWLSQMQEGDWLVKTPFWAGMTGSAWPCSVWCSCRTWRWDCRVSN